MTVTTTGGPVTGSGADALRSLVAAASAGNADAFAALAERYRAELRLHCYRMVGSLEDSEDVVQETLLRAWTRRGSYAARSTYRAWLYGIATHACLDLLRRRRSRVLPPDVAPAGDPSAGPAPVADIPWLDPYPDHLIDAAAAELEPESVLISRENTELAFLAAIQHLPPRQRAVLILRDVLDWPARQVAEVLETTVTGVNSALQRAHATMARYLPVDESRGSTASRTAISKRERTLLGALMGAWERADVSGVAALLRDDARLVMPPTPTWFDGRDAIATFLTVHGFASHGPGRFATVATAANRQPALALYVGAEGATVRRAFALIVVCADGDEIRELALFRKPELFEAWRLPPEI
jgi:RNA polymerase sigma-70 factor, ECF subfamily